MSTVLGKAKSSSRRHLGLVGNSLGHRLTKVKTSRMKQREIETYFGPNDGSSAPDVETAIRPQIQIRPHVDYDTERAAYARRKVDLLREAPGRFVVFVGQEMIGPYDDFRTAHQNGLRRFGPGPLYIKQILSIEPSAESGANESCPS